MNSQEEETPSIEDLWPGNGIYSVMFKDKHIGTYPGTIRVNGPNAVTVFMAGKRAPGKGLNVTLTGRRSIDGQTEVFDRDDTFVIDPDGATGIYREGPSSAPYEVGIYFVAFKEITPLGQEVSP